MEDLSSNQLSIRTPLTLPTLYEIKKTQLNTMAAVDIQIINFVGMAKDLRSKPSLELLILKDKPRY